MKNLFITILVLSSILSLRTKAGNAGLFYLNAQQIEKEFKQLTELENYLVFHHASLNALIQTHNPILNKTGLENSNQTVPLRMMFEYKDVDWGSFAWGFCCWPVGCLIVPFNKNKDDNEKLSFFYGMLSFYTISTIYQISVLIKAGNSISTY
ncbi:MAG: hypothetical protein GXO79_13015 [Chlorobi bacterium]|nr:hypothetical protein [Chlorobiota bacterium]